MTAYKHELLLRSRKKGRLEVIQLSVSTTPGNFSVIQTEGMHCETRPSSQQQAALHLPTQACFTLVKERGGIYRANVIIVVHRASKQPSNGC